MIPLAIALQGREHHHQDRQDQQTHRHQKEAHYTASPESHSESSSHGWHAFEGSPSVGVGGDLHTDEARQHTGQAADQEGNEGKGFPLHVFHSALSIHCEVDHQREEG